MADLERAHDFYRDGLGLESRGVLGTEHVGDDINPADAIVLFDLQNGLLLSLYPRTELAKDANITLGPPTAGDFSIGHAVASKPRSTPSSPKPRLPEPRSLTSSRPSVGNYGYFRDPDGHLWGDPLEPTPPQLTGLERPRGDAGRVAHDYLAGSLLAVP